MTATKQREQQLGAPGVYGLTAELGKSGVQVRRAGPCRGPEGAPLGPLPQLGAAAAGWAPLRLRRPSCCHSAVFRVSLRAVVTLFSPLVPASAA